MNILFVRDGVRYAEPPGYPGYAVGEDGRVASRWHPRKRVLQDCWHYLRPGVNGKGYLQVALYAEGKRRYVSVHKLVLEAFVGPCPRGLEVCHADDVRCHNHLDNLSYGTRSTNARQRERRKRER